MRKIIGFILTWLLIACQMDIYQPDQTTLAPTGDYSLKIDSGNHRFLQKILCRQLEKNGFHTTCNQKWQQKKKFYLEKGQELILAEPQKEQFLLQVRPVLHSISHDFLRNNLMSLATLTSGAFVSTSGVVDYRVSLHKDGKMWIQTSIKGEGRIGFYSFLPFYMGWLATNLGTGLNSYRLPDHLEKKCLYEKPQGYEIYLSQNHARFCQDYQRFLSDSFYRIEKKIYSLIRTQIVTGYYYEKGP